MSEVAETLAKLHLPPDLNPPSTPSYLTVPLLKKSSTGDARHQIALLIREGRKASQQLSRGVAEASKGSGSSRETLSLPLGIGTDTLTTLSTVLEQDFTIKGKKGILACPFSPPEEAAPEKMAGEDDAHISNADLTGTTADPTSHSLEDPVCAAMFEQSSPDQPAGDANVSPAAKCPIRFLDKHSPEELARYVETHKHEIPRSHEVCVARYQRNEVQIRKLDAKYGNLVSMINDLSHLHQPMLPSAADADEIQDDVDRASNKRVESWAQAVSLSDPDQEDQADEAPTEDDEDRQSHFDRPLRDVRVGESPSRPWGISVPVYHTFSHQDAERPESPPPAPVRMPSPENSPQPRAAAGKCPFDHTKFANLPIPFPIPAVGATSPLAAVRLDPAAERPMTPVKEPVTPQVEVPRPAMAEPSAVPVAQAEPKPTPTPAAASGRASPPAPVTININGPIFIGYPADQAMQFLQQLQQLQGQR